MFAAAGMVVTLMNTPTSALDFEAVRDTIPAAPAMSAVTTLKTSGCATNEVSGRWPAT
jgi:hypothetical protein